MNTYLTLKSLHLLGVIIFLGNIIVTGWWKVMADRTKNPVIIAFAQRQVTLTDYIFTTGGVILILVTGIGNAVLHEMDYLSIVWLAWGFWLFILSGVIWAVILIPIQIKLAKMSQQFSKDGLIPDNYWHLERLWLFFGILATLLPLFNIYWMVFKSN
ncbi:integral membrane protein [Candidatus Thiomargarita nelsonii]|uniref:Integral membrane protein n=1 Tax=Candidatus Thiomargarita nelsonii TaxID=1003181 RepID=A0A176RSG3_9GAMM|nr:integral membrane protein [Candidatus Thiomargarita nelsonii]